MVSCVMVGMGNSKTLINQARIKLFYQTSFVSQILIVHLQNHHADTLIHLYGLRWKGGDDIMESVYLALCS